MSIKAVFLTGQTDITVNGLHQWDYGQQLEIRASDLPALVEVHFACLGMSEATVRSCAIVDGVGSVAIPDKCLEQTAPIMAWVYAIGDNVGATVKTIVLNVIERARPAPGGEIPTDVSNAYTELITEVNKQVGSLKEGNVTVANAVNAKYAEHAESAEVAKGAPSGNGKAYTEDGDEQGHVFNFSNTTGFGLYGGEDQGHFKLWSKDKDGNGKFYCCLVPSRDSAMMLGASDHRYDRIYANEFIGTADEAKKASSLELPAGYTSYTEGDTLDSGLYLFRVTMSLNDTPQRTFQAMVGVYAVSNASYVMLGVDAHTFYVAYIKDNTLTLYERSIQEAGVYSFKLCANVDNQSYTIDYKKICS